MAIAGGACSAYRVRWDTEKKWLHTRSTSMLRSECTPVEEAVVKLHAGEQVTVAGSDMAEVRRRMLPDEGERPTPADGDGYTYDLRTGPERAQAQLDDLAGRVRRLEAQYSQEIRTLAERLQQIEHVLDQYAGDHR